MRISRDFWFAERFSSIIFRPHYKRFTRPGSASVNIGECMPRNHSIKQSQQRRRQSPSAALATCVFSELLSREPRIPSSTGGL